MIIVIGPNPVALEELPEALQHRAPLLYADWHRNYLMLSGDAALQPPAAHSMARIVADLVQAGQQTMLVGMSGKSNKRIARLLRHFPEVIGVRGLRPAAAILDHTDPDEVPSNAAAAAILGWPTALLSTPIPRSLAPMALLVGEEPVSQSEIPNLAQEVADQSTCVAIVPHSANGTPGDALWIADTPVLRMTEWEGAGDSKEVKKVSVKRRLAQLARLRPQLDPAAQRWRALAQQTRSDLRVPGVPRNPGSTPDLLAGKADSSDTGPADYQLAIGSLNTAGQAFQWARAARGQGLNAVSNQYIRRNQQFVFPADINTAPQHSNLRRRINVFEHLMQAKPHVLMESLSSFANLPRVGGGPRQGLAQVGAFALSGITAGVVFHGSDVRRPSRYRETHEFSPYGPEADQDFVSRLEAQTALVAELLRDYDGPTFVSTLDLIDDLSDGIWLPQVVDPAFFTTADIPQTSAAIPIVVHAPSHAGFKGSDIIDPILTELHREGIIRYRRIRGIRPEHMPAVFAQADIVVDQVLMNLCSGTAAETMAAGRVVLANTTGFIAQRYPADLPTVHVNPTNLRDTLRELAGQPERRRALGLAGRDYAREYHDGRYSGKVLTEWVNGTRGNFS